MHSEGADLTRAGNAFEALKSDDSILHYSLAKSSLTTLMRGLWVSASCSGYHLQGSICQPHRSEYAHTAALKHMEACADVFLGPAAALWLKQCTLVSDIFMVT